MRQLLCILTEQWLMDTIKDRVNVRRFDGIGYLPALASSSAA